MENLSFSEALTLLKAGHSISRAAWPAGQALTAASLDGKSGSDFVALTTLEGKGTRSEPWSPRHADLLASDWEAS